MPSKIYFRLDAKRELEALRAKEEKIMELRKKRQSVKQFEIQKVDAGKELSFHS